MAEVEQVKDQSKRIVKEVWRALRDAVEVYSKDLVKQAEPPAPPPKKRPSKAKPKSAPQPETLPQPHEVSPGAHHYHDGWVSFALFAPGKGTVALVGPFNEWNTEANPMHDLGEGLWWTSFQLPSGEHPYQFVVDGSLYICDPYAREVLWDGSGPKAVVRVGHDPYGWHDDAFRARPLHDLIVYEVHVGDFTPEGTFEGLRQRLDYIQSLGVTAIELMPICEFPMDRSWGYNSTFYMAPERAYGTPDDLKRLIDEAHARGIAVILDMVFNHVQQDSPLNLMWSYDQSPYFSGDNPWGMPDFNHFSDFTKAYVRDVQDFWLREYHVDGFRYDATAYIASDAMNGIGFFTWAARQTKPDVYLISEHLPQDPWWIHNTEMDAQWHDSFHDVMKAQLREGAFEGGHQWGNLDAVERALNFALDGYSHPRDVINYVASHDEQRIIHEVLSNPNLNEETAYRKAKLGMATVLTAAGVPMLYAGEEIGMNRERSTDLVPFEWERLAGDGRAQDLVGTWQHLAWLRNTHPALRAPHFSTLAKWGERKAICFSRSDDAGDIVVVVLNFSDEGFKLGVPFPAPGTWHEYNHGFAVAVDADHTVEVDVPPSGSLIFCTVKNW